MIYSFEANTKYTASAVLKILISRVLSMSENAHVQLIQSFEKSIFRYPVNIQATNGSDALKTLNNL